MVAWDAIKPTQFGRLRDRHWQREARSGSVACPPPGDLFLEK
jgi:hypothetical protein